MWLDLWEKVRGYDKWIEAQAIVHSPDPHNPSEDDEDQDESAWDGDILVWTDRHGNAHSADFMVPDDSPLYQKVAGDTLLIRYNPRRPDRFYFRQLHRVRIATTLKRALITISIIGLIIMALWVHQKP